MRADVQTLLANTEVVEDPDLTKLYPAKFPARVTVTLKDGRTFTDQRDFPKGDPQDPLSPSEIEAKFLDNAAACYTPAEARELVRLVRGLPEATHCTPLFQLLTR